MSAPMTAAIALIEVVLFCKDHVTLLVVVKINMFNQLVRHL